MNLQTFRSLARRLGAVARVAVAVTLVSFAAFAVGCQTPNDKNVRAAAEGTHGELSKAVLTDPEMAGYIQEELNENARAGRVNATSNVRLLQGDLSEAWREGSAEYATVAMRFSMIDVTRDKATGRVLEGDPINPTEASELWTFRRDNGGPWKLSAIQQA